MNLMLARSWRIVARTLLVAAGACAGTSSYPQDAPSEYALKAAFVYQFLSYVTWPDGNASADGRIHIGVVGAQELVDNLQTIAESPEGSLRMIDISRLELDGDARDLQVLFVGTAFTDGADLLLQGAVANAVLTVTEELPRPANSIINFEIIDNRVRFDIDLALAREHGMDISARLLQVALRVLDQP